MLSFAWNKHNGTIPRMHNSMKVKSNQQGKADWSSETWYVSRLWRRSEVKWSYLPSATFPTWPSTPHYYSDQANHCTWPGFEPRTSQLWSKCSPDWANEARYAYRATGTRQVQNWSEMISEQMGEPRFWHVINKIAIVSTKILNCCWHPIWLRIFNLKCYCMGCVCKELHTSNICSLLVMENMSSHSPNYSRVHYEQ